MHLSSPHNPPCSRPDRLLPPPAPSALSEFASTHAPRGTKRSVVETIVSPLSSDSNGLTAGSHTGGFRASENVSKLGLSSRSRDQASGIHTRSGGTTSSVAPAPSALLVTSTHLGTVVLYTPSSTEGSIVDWARPTTPIRPTALRGPASNPVQAEPLPQQIVARGPIARSLYPDPITCFILVIAVSVDGLRDPHIDLDFIRGAFKSPKLRVSSLLNEEVTHEAIERELGVLYRQACKNTAPSQIFVHLTGMGDTLGNMCLFREATVGPQDLRCWLGKLRSKSTSPQVAVGVVFDVCRRGGAPLDPDSESNLDHDLALVRTCMPGQWAYALYFGPGLPSSLFLSSLFLAAHDILVGSESFEDAFKSRVAQQGRMLRFIHSRRHEGKNCEECPDDGKCGQPGLQECEWGEAGRDTLLNLGELIITTLPNVAHWVEEKVTAKMSACRFLEWGLNAGVVQAAARSSLAAEVSTQPMPSVPGAVHTRGRTQAASQTMAPSTVV